MKSRPPISLKTGNSNNNNNNNNNKLKTHTAPQIDSHTFRYPDWKLQGEIPRHVQRLSKKAKKLNRRLALYNTLSVLTFAQHSAGGGRAVKHRCLSGVFREFVCFCFWLLLFFCWRRFREWSGGGTGREGGWVGGGGGAEKLRRLSLC